MLENQIDQAERNRVLENDRRVMEQREQERRVFADDQSLPRPGTTYNQFAQSDADIPRGRFTEHERSTVVGAQPTINYPAAAAHQHDPVGQEPALGYRIDEMPALDEPSTVLLSSPVEQTCPMSDASLSPLQREDVGPFSSHPAPTDADMAAQCISQMSSSSLQGHDVRAERPPAFRRRRL
jgi:hypothetical protein